MHILNKGLNNCGVTEMKCRNWSPLWSFTLVNLYACKYIWYLCIWFRAFENTHRMWVNSLHTGKFVVKWQVVKINYIQFNLYCYHSFRYDDAYNAYSKFSTKQHQLVIKDLKFTDTFTCSVKIRENVTLLKLQISFCWYWLSLWNVFLSLT